MAPGEDFESTTRETLLDVVLDKLQKAGKTVIFSRLIYVANFDQRMSNADGLKDFYTKVLDKVDANGEVTGLLVVYPSCMMHMLEARTSTLMAFLREVQEADAADHGMREARVIASTEDIPHKCYSAWHTAFVNTASSVDTMDPADAGAFPRPLYLVVPLPHAHSLVKSATELNNFLRSIGPSLRTLSENEVSRRLGSMDRYYQDIPTPEVLLSLVPSEEAPTIEEYLDIFDAPVNVDLDSEQVWPMPKAPKY